ncbi:putative hexokinase [Triangularia setosa]|uniref:Phosphotransferase n=1 Tax=Triangularia setosa TaxID=2587417 RepID=A0AAN6W385_9PEZI|nr:putative hexokinase [Podospora setosa]
MCSFIFTMTSLRDLLLAAIKSLSRGRSFLQALLAFCTTSNAPSPASHDAIQEPGKNGPILITEFLAEVERLLLVSAIPNRLGGLSQKLKLEFREGLLSNPACMLPSYHTELPTGDESGQYLAVDVGGSTLRVALVDLKGRGSSGCPESRIVTMDTFGIDNDIRSLEGRAFFDWMAERIYQTVAQDSKKGHGPDEPLLLGLSWSFPIEQTSPQTYLLRPMGKGFLAADDGLLGQDLGQIIQSSCRNLNLHVSLSAIVNDSSATLLSAAYSHPATTTFGLVLGTGVNIAAHLPICTISTEKYGNHHPQDGATHVVVNTELGMFGGNSLPLTKWDGLLKSAHPRPDFQPLEHLVSGYYLGEVCRLILVDAIASVGGVFGGVVPPSLARAYGLDTKTLSLIEGDPSPSLSHFQSLHPSPIPATTTDLHLLRSIASLVSQRSASILAASLYALHEINLEASLSAQPPSPERTTATTTTIAYSGSVIEHYPNYLSHLQRFLDELTVNSNTSFKLISAKESSVLGAAVALACLDK